jgi:hypothetical protein
MIYLRRLILFTLLTCISLLVSPVAAQTNEAKRGGPVVNDCEPHSGSVNSVIELKGFRLGLDEPESAKAAFVIQNGIEIPARTGGGSSVTNDRLNGAQSLEVILPEQVVPGPAQIVVERNGVRSVPVAITITEWLLPVIKKMTPASGAPGTSVDVECENFHINDVIELTDVEGRVVKKYESGGSAWGTGFVVPEDFPEGVLRVRIGNRKLGKNQFTAPVEFIVTNDPLPPEILSEWLTSVAPGQWIDLASSTPLQLQKSEQTEVSFKQAGRETIVSLPHGARSRVEVPSLLAPGEVQLQVRTTRNGRQSKWSTPATLKLLDKPLPPYVQGIRLEKTSWVQLWPGPDRAKKFTAAPGDLIVMNGTFPVAGADKLKVSLVKLGEVVELDVTELNEKAEWLNDLAVRLPGDMASGDWQMTLRATDGSQHVVPIPIRILQK